MTGFWRCICQRPAGANVVAMDDHVALEHKAQAEVAKWQNSAVEDQARIRELEALLKSIRGYMFPGNVMPVPEQAKYIVQWINSALETEAKPPVQYMCVCEVGDCHKGRLKSNEYCYDDRERAGLAQETEVAK